MLIHFLLVTCLNAACLWLLSLQIRPDRQTLLWSATWPKEIQALAREFLHDPYQASPEPRRPQPGTASGVDCVGVKS